MYYLAVAFITGCLAILLGVTPVGDLFETFRDEFDRFRDSLYGLQLKPVRRMVNLNRGGRLHGQIWFAVAGVALILFALLAYLAS
ncbi:MAG TPA: hypothetical protein VK335_15005 [Bryobacteraceae bacterium]|nr:hypothetical protein [Bryobacteraceae bacterium]